MKFSISKIDAAKRQLESAIRLFFVHGDPISIHALACAAREILSDVCGQQGVKSLRDEILDKVIPEKREEVRRRFQKEQNFFKHADRDPGDVMEFDPEITYFDIWDACELYKKLIYEAPPLLILFRMWFFANYPDVLLPGEDKDKALQFAKAFDPKNRAAYLAGLPEIERLAAGLQSPSGL